MEFGFEFGDIMCSATFCPVDIRLVELVHHFLRKCCLKFDKAGLICGGGEVLQSWRPHRYNLRYVSFGWYYYICGGLNRGNTKNSKDWLKDVEMEAKRMYHKKKSQMAENLV